MEPRIVIKSEERRLVYGEVYAPMQIDTDGEAMTAQEIERMAHKFLASGRTSKIDVAHDHSESGCLAVESFIARKEDPDGFVLGSWVLGVIVVPDELWKAVKSGELNGFSFAGGVEKEQVTAKVTVVKKMLGDTEKSAEDGMVPSHIHKIDIRFDEDGRIANGSTAEEMGHIHLITKTTATEREMEHSHRLILIDNKEN